jgi:hypothetical protein
VRLDTSEAESLTVSFWYRNHGVSTMKLQLWDGVTYRTVVNLGASTPDDKWHYYSLQTYDPRFLGTDFRVRFSPDGLVGQGQEFWVDDFGLCRSLSIMDYSGQGNHGTIHGTTWIDEGAVGGAYSFDGVNDYIYVPDDPSLGGDGDFSELGIEFWINPSELRSGSRILVKKVPSQSAGSYMVGFQSSGSPSNTLFFGIISTADSQWHEVFDDNLTNIPVGVWSHVVCTYKSGEGLSIFINGELRVNSPLTGNISLGLESPSSVYGRPVFIGFDGSWNSYRWFAGSLDEVMIYPRALSSSQVLQRYIEAKGGLSGNSTIVPDETHKDDIWVCKVTPNDSFGDGQTYATLPFSLSQTQPTPNSSSSDTNSNTQDTLPKTEPSPSPSISPTKPDNPSPTQSPGPGSSDSSAFPSRATLTAFTLILILIAITATAFFFIVRRK